MNRYRVEVIETFSTLYYVDAESEAAASEAWTSLEPVDCFGNGIADILIDLIGEDV